MDPIADWQTLTEGQRNCSIWPDLIEWEQEPHKVIIHRENPKSGIGLVSTAIQDPGTQRYYNIVKRIEQGRPADIGGIKPHQWICSINGESTLKCNGGLSSLIGNEKNDVSLSLRKAIDPLKNVKTWGREKVVNIYLIEKVGPELLHHFYSKACDEEIQDQILIWKVETLRGAGGGTSKPVLHRGDKLLEVNRVTVEGKKLKDIFGLMFQKIPGNVELKIKQIQAHCSDQQEEAPKSSIVEKETDPKAGQEDMPKSEVCENTPTLVERLLPKAIATGPVSSLADTVHRRQLQGSFSRNPQSQLSIGKNEGYQDSSNENTPKARRKSMADKMCKGCLHRNKPMLPEDRNEWPINKIDPTTHRDMCELLDLNHGKEPLLEALGCFPTSEVTKLQRKYNQPGVIGLLPKEALGTWGNEDRTHNVGKLKEIVETKMRRIDVLQAIEDWKKLSVCHGCGVRLN